MSIPSVVVAVVLSRDGVARDVFTDGVARDVLKTGVEVRDDGFLSRNQLLCSLSWLN